ncbi:MAG: LysR substrate-binding domain-containing protein [Hyphomonadaceae bacterium]|nr:LysR substrate-binding domain-containing protein [Hyphomonadaceae bacterium]
MASSIDPPLAALRAFQEAARAHSFLEAARTLGVTPSAVSHRIRGLEAQIGAPLFVRQTRSVALTPAGARLFAAIDPAFAAIARALDQARAEGADTRLKVSALAFITNHWLIPRLARFEARHPGVSIEIESSNRLADFEGDGVDVAIRNSAAPTAGLVARKLIDVRAEVLCAPAVQTGPHPLRTPADLANHTLIHIAPRLSAWPQWLTAAGVADLKPAGEIAFDNIPAALEAAAANRGVALTWAPLVWDSPAADRLAAPFPPVKAAPTGSYYVVSRRADRARPVVQAFVTWICGEMAADRRRLGRLDAQRRHGGDRGGDGGERT